VQQSGEFRIKASREAVWQALNDPAVLQRCIEGCDEMQRVDDTHFVATVRAKVGPVSATFHGEVTLQDLDPPNGYTLVGAGKGGAAGFARGEAKVRLVEVAPGETLLQYEMDAKVGGKLAQIGSRLIDGAARKMAEDFFGRFSEVLGGPAQAVAFVDATSHATAEPAAAALADAPSAAEDAAKAMAEAAVNHASQGAGKATPGDTAGRAYQPSGQGLVWLVVLGVVVLALVLAAL
jgi:hypothetical protein